MAYRSILAPQIGAAIAAAVMAVVGISNADPAVSVPTLDAGSAASASAALVSDLSAFGPSVTLGEALSVQATQTGIPLRAETSPITEPVVVTDEILDDTRPMLAVMIDDVGLDAAAAELLLGLDYPVTLSVLPYADMAPLIAEAAKVLGKDVFLHLPMEPIGDEDPGPDALNTDMSRDEIAERLIDALSVVPNATGFNNHMGSAFTQNAQSMGYVFESLSDLGSELVFVDSLTHTASIGEQSARAVGFTAFSRDVFLDHGGGEGAADQLDLALELALAQGHAIAIGHPYPQTLEALDDLMIKAQNAGVRLVTMEELSQSQRVIQSG